MATTIILFFLLFILSKFKKIIIQSSLTPVTFVAPPDLSCHNHIVDSQLCNIPIKSSNSQTTKWSLNNYITNTKIISLTFSNDVSRPDLDENLYDVDRTITS